MNVFESIENFYFTFSITNMAENERKGAFQTIISCISNNFEALQGYKLKTWGFQTRSLKFQHKN